MLTTLTMSELFCLFKQLEIEIACRETYPNCLVTEKEGIRSLQNEHLSLLLKEVTKEMYERKYSLSKKILFIEDIGQITVSL